MNDVTKYCVLFCYCQVPPVNNSNQQTVDVRETLEYKKAMELQLWLEEQQMLYKTQVIIA